MPWSPRSLLARYFRTKRNIVPDVAKSMAEDEFLDTDEARSWSALMLLNRFVLQSLDAELRAVHGLAVSEFDVLTTLLDAPRHRLRMSELAERVLLSPAGTTHLVTRLERDGLARREVDAA